MPGRSFSSNSYRYGFNGMEKDDEVKGSGNSYDFGARIYDPRLGRFLSIDPFAAEFSWQSPYVFAENNPVRLIDENGESASDPQEKPKSKAAIPLMTSPEIMRKAQAWSKVFNALQNHLENTTGRSIDRKTLMKAVNVEIFLDGEASQTFVDGTVPQIEKGILFVVSPKTPTNIQSSSSELGNYMK
jgi:RHS repeat-associated protein